MIEYVYSHVDCKESLESVCDELVEFGIANPDKFDRRSGSYSNETLDNSESNYYTLYSIPSSITSKLDELLPTYKGLGASKYVLNKYDVGDYIPWHIDADNQLASGILFLDSYHSCLAYMKGDEEVLVQDEKGTVVYLNSVEVKGRVKHKVYPVKDKPRYTLIIII